MVRRAQGAGCRGSGEAYRVAVTEGIRCSGVEAVVAVGPGSSWESKGLPGLLEAGADRIFTVHGASSIHEAWDAGLRCARSPVVAFVHDDLELLRPDAFAEAHEALASMPPGSVVGCAGGGTPGSPPVIPWWSDPWRWSALSGAKEPRPREPTFVSLLDGVCLVQRDPWPWTRLPWSWHGYDANRSLETAERGGRLAVLPALTARHETRRKDKDHLIEHARACRALASRWGARCARFGGST